MKAKKLLFYAIAGVLCGCVPSLHCLFTDKELVFEEKLLGIWAEDNSEETWEFKRYSDEADKTYKLIYTDSDGQAGEFAAKLGKLDKMMYLDLYPEAPDINANDFYIHHLLGVHTFMKIEQIEPTLQMRLMSPDKMKEMLEANPNLIKHEILEERDSQVLLTASTKELQRFIIEYAKDEGLFDEPSDMKRLEVKEPKEPNAVEPAGAESNAVEADQNRREN
ncbi:MAG: hypothetical protein ACYSYT_00915 [Planctomycetota bacterium]|jgi:hypothetical protein